MTRKTLASCLKAAVLIAVLAPAVRAEEKKPDAFTKTVAQAVITCIRPSSQLHKEDKYLPRIVSHKYTSPKKGRLDLEVKMGWNGLWTKDPYGSTFKIKMEFDGKQVEILGVDYEDDCLVPAPDLRLINTVIRELNKKFADARRGSDDK